MPHLHKHLIQECCDGCLAVGSGNTNKLQPLGWVPVERGRKAAGNMLCIIHFHVCDIRVQFLRHLFAYYCCSSFLLGSSYVGMSVGLCSLYGNEHIPLLYQAGIYMDSLYFRLFLRQDKTVILNVSEQFAKYHSYIIFNYIIQ